MSTNPYAPPQMDTSTPPIDVAYTSTRPASQGKRFCNLLLDGVVTFVLSGGVGFILGFVFALSKVSSGGSITREDEATLNLAGMVAGWIVTWLYFTFTEGLFQRSVAKFVTGTIVVTTAGGKPTMSQIMGRSLARFIPFEAFSFLGGGGYPIGWHDSLSRTKVIDTPKY